MPISGYEDNGLLELDGNHYLKLIEQLSSLAGDDINEQLTNVDTPVSELKIKAFEFISSQIDKFKCNHEIEKEANNFDLCLKIFESLCTTYKSSIDICLGVRQSLLSQFIDILKDEQCKEYHTHISKLLSISYGAFTDEQISQLKELQLNNKTSIDLVDLFIAKDLITVEIAKDIIKEVSNNSSNTEVTKIYKQQLINIVKSFNSDIKLREELGPYVIEYIKESTDYPLLDIVFGLVNDKSFFKPIIEEIKSKIELITNLLEVHKSLDELTTKTNVTVINKYKYVIDNADIAVTELIKKLLQAVVNINNPNPITINNKSFNPLEIIKIINIVQNRLSSLLSNGISFDEEFISSYEIYVKEVITNEYLKSRIGGLLNVIISSNNVFISSNIILSTELTESLIKNISLIPFEFDANNKILYSFLSLLAKKDQIPESCYETVKDLCSKYLHAANGASLVDACVIVKHLTDKGSSCETLMEYLICNYLGSHLNSKILEIIEHAIGEITLSDSVISSLVDFVIDNQKPIHIRIKVANSLAKISNNLSEELLKKLLPLVNSVLNTINQEAENNNYTAFVNEITGFDFEEMNRAGSGIRDFVSENVALSNKIIRIIASFACGHNKLDKTSLKLLEESINNQYLKYEAINSLKTIILKNPDLLSVELHEIIKNSNNASSQESEARSSLDNLHIEPNDEGIVGPIQDEVNNTNRSEILAEENKVESLDNEEATTNIISEEIRIKISNILKTKFSDLQNIDVLINKIGKLNVNLSEKFVDEILFDLVLSKANSLVEFEKFLEFINKYKLEEIEIIRYLSGDTVEEIIDSYEITILEKSLEELEEKVGIDEVYRIKEYYQHLKFRGFGALTLALITEKINASNIGIYKDLLELVYEYKIGNDDKNLEGKNAIDIISGDLNQGNIAEKSKELFSIVNNKFEQQSERKGEDLIKEIIKLNPWIEGKSSLYLSILESVNNIYEAQENGICKLSVENLKKRVSEFKEKRKSENNHNIFENKELLSEVIALLQRAYNLDTGSVGKDGHLYRDTQILSLLMSLDTDVSSRGKLLQIATGEGKSAISASLAAILVLYGRSVDIITSSSVLAVTGHTNSLGFFEILGISSSVNIGGREINGIKPCYKSDIVYGDNLNFQADFLSNTSRKGSMRGEREFRACVVDEVDSMLVDGSGTMSKQSASVPLMEYLLGIFTHSSNHFQKEVEGISSINYLEAIEFAEILINHYIKELPIPKNFVGFAKHQARVWAENLVYANFRYELERDYVININEEGIREINPVDKSTGVTQEKTVWQNGLHQFLQIKHNLRLTSEGLTSFFITNITYFKKYEKLYGMSGTLGSEHSQNFIREIFGLDMEFMPTFRHKQLQELEERVYDSYEEYASKIEKEVIRQGYENKRAVLVVCKTIKDAQSLEERIRDACTKQGIDKKVKIESYIRSESNYSSASLVYEEVNPRTIIISTNLAGRGTDFRTIFELEANGGLHVISTFMAASSRDEEQVKGRTARQGNSGTYQLILLDEQDASFYEENLGSDLNEAERSQFKKIVRDLEEKELVKEKVEIKIPDLLKKDKLYERFSQLYREFRSSAYDEKYALINQYIEDFGLWLEMREETGITIDEFIESAKSKFARKEFSNPSYMLTIFGGGSGGLKVAHEYSQTARLHDSGFYNLAADYYSAKYVIEETERSVQNKARGSDEDEVDPSYKSYAHNDIAQARDKLEELINYMTSVCMTVATNRDVSKDNDTAKQIASKVEFLRNLAKQMEDAMSVIASCPADSHIRVKGNKTISELSSDLTKSDIQEIEFLGIANIFELEIFKPEVRYSPFMEIFIGACAILQMAAGLMITVGSVGAGSSFGASIFAEGIMDAYRLARGEGGVDLAEYFTQKGISYACMGVQAGIGKLASSASAKAAAGKLMEESAKQGISLTTEQAKALVATHALEVSAIAAANQTKGALIEQAIKVAGTQVAMAIGTQILAEKVSGFVRKSAFEGLEERISSRIENASYDELGRHMSLTDAKAQIEQDQLLRAGGRIATKLLHEPRNMRIVKELSRAVLSTVTSHALSGSSRLAALATNFAISGMQSAASSTDIMPLADELADEVRVEIATKDTAAKTRLAREKQAGNKDAVAKVEGDEGNRRNLSHRLGEIGAGYIMSAVEGRVIAPIVSVAAGKVIDMAVGTYMRAQEELLREYHSQYHAAKATAVMGVAAGDSGAVGANRQGEEEVEGLPWLNENGEGNNTGVAKKAGGKAGGSEKLDGLPWLNGNGEGNNSGVAKKAGGKWAGGFTDEEIVVSKPHVQKAKAALKLTIKTPSAVQRAEEEAASQRVIAAIKLKEQMLGMPVTDEELSALALTSERPIYITENGKYHAAFGTSIKGKPLVVERETPGFVEQKVKWVAGNLLLNVVEAKAYIERTGNTDILDNAVKTMQVVSYLAAASRGAAATAALGSIIPGAGTGIGALVGGVAGIAQQCTIDTVTDEGIHIASQGFQNQFPSLTPEEANILAVATMITAGSTKAAKDYLQKHFFSSVTSTSKHVSDLATDSTHAKVTTIHASEVKTPTASSNKINETTTGVSKKVEFDTAIPETHIADGIKYEGGTTLTAREIVVENPHIMKHYVNEIAELTEQGALHKKQIIPLKDALREQEFVKLDKPAQDIHRYKFGNVKDNLRQEWCKQTGKEWPVYEKDYYYTNGKLARSKGDPYDAHHIIPVSHGGPNEWWNMHPTSLESHQQIHGAGSVFKEIFNSKTKQ